MPIRTKDDGSGAKLPPPPGVVSVLPDTSPVVIRSEEHTSELQSLRHLACRHRVLLSVPPRRSSDLRVRSPLACEKEVLSDCRRAPQPPPRIADNSQDADAHQDEGRRLRS